MEGFLKQSTAVNITVLLISSTDHISGKTGATLTIYATKAAGTPASITPTVTELSSTNTPGLYKLALTTAHTDTLGELQLHITATGADPADYKWQVSTYLPGEAVIVQSGTGTGQISLSSGAVTVGTNNDKTGYTVSTVSDKTGYSLSSAGVQAIWDALTSALTTVSSIGKLLVDNINATISSRLASASYTAPLDAAGTRSAIGLASANLDTQLSTIDTNVDSILVDTGTDIPASIAALPTAAQNADAIWDEALSGHTTAGTAGKALSDAGAAGDPWSTSVPGAYGAGTAGYILGTNLNATISSRASQTSLDTLDDYVDTEVSAIKAKTDNLPADPADASDIAASFTTVNTKLDTIDDLLDTEVAAIKAKTDSLTFTVAGQVDTNIRSINDTALAGNGSTIPWGPA